MTTLLRPCTTAAATGSTRRVHTDDSSNTEQDQSDYSQEGPRRQRPRPKPARFTHHQARPGRRRQEEEVAR